MAAQNAFLVGKCKEFPKKLKFSFPTEFFLEIWLKVFPNLYKFIYEIKIEKSYFV